MAASKPLNLVYLCFVSNCAFCLSVAHDEAVAVGQPSGQRLDLWRGVLGQRPPARGRLGCAWLDQPDLSHEETLLQ